MNSRRITVTVCYASRAGRQEVVTVTLPARATVLDAIQKSGILGRCPEVDPAENKVGIFGEIVETGRVLCDRDRVEIYRPLACSPMEARRRRAAAGRRGARH